MEFLSRDESSMLEKKLRREIAEYDNPKFIVYYNGGGRDYAPAANAIAESAGNFSGAMLLYLWSISGDPATDPRWNRYNSWRFAHHEPRQLYEAPGHRFGPEEAERFSNAVEFALELGWDAVITAKPGRQLLFLSHDDRLEIYHGFRGGQLVRQLTGLGYWHR